MNVDEGGQDESQDQATDKSGSDRSLERPLSELGLLVLRSIDVYPQLILTIFRAVAWTDTAVCNRCLNLCFPILKQIVALQLMSSEDAADFLGAILMGLPVHGQHEAVQAVLITACLDTYELLRPLFPSVAQVMMQIPGCSEKELKYFDDGLLSDMKKQEKTRKKRKAMFKNLVKGIISKNIGQQYRNESKIKNLAPFRSNRYKPTALVDTLGKQDVDIGLCALFAT
jgi:exportin-5